MTEVELTGYERILICPTCEGRKVVEEGRTVITEVVPTTFEDAWGREVEQPTKICRTVDQHRCLKCGEIWYLELHMGARFPKEWERGCNGKKKEKEANHG